MGERQQGPLNPALTGPSSIKAARTACGVESIWVGGRWALCVGCPGALATKPVEPGCDGLRVHAQTRGNLYKALAVHDGEDGEEIFDLAQAA
jgi:hypothetical protein